MSRKDDHHPRGSFGIAASVLFLLISLLAVIVPKIVYNSISVVRSCADRESAFWLAEGGVSLLKLRIAKVPGWYTDLPHLPEDDRSWLCGSSLGETMALPGGQVKVIKEQGADRSYAIGKAKGAVVIIKIDGGGWREL